MIKAKIRDIGIYARISPDVIKTHLESLGGWEVTRHVGGIQTWANRSHKNHWGECAIFEIPEDREWWRWGWECYQGIGWLTAIEERTVLDYLVSFGAIKVSDLFTCVDSSIDEVFRDLMTKL